MKIIATVAIVLAALGMVAYKYVDYIVYPWTRDGLVRAQVIQMVPRVSGQLVDVPIRNNQVVKQGDLLFAIDPSTFQATVDFARAERDNMRDIVKSLAEQVDGMRAAVAQSESARNQAMFELAADIEKTDNARIEFERIKTVIAQGTGSQR